MEGSETLFLCVHILSFTNLRLQVDCSIVQFIRINCCYVVSLSVLVYEHIYT